MSWATYWKTMKLNIIAIKGKKVNYTGLKINHHTKEHFISWKEYDSADVGWGKWRLERQVPDKPKVGQD